MITTVLSCLLVFRFLGFREFCYWNNRLWCSWWLDFGNLVFLIQFIWQLRQHNLLFYIFVCLLSCHSILLVALHQHWYNLSWNYQSSPLKLYHLFSKSFLLIINVIFQALCDKYLLALIQKYQPFFVIFVFSLNEAHHPGTYDEHESFPA